MPPCEAFIQIPIVWGLESFQEGEHIHVWEGDTVQLHRASLSGAQDTPRPHSVYVFIWLLSVSFIIFFDKPVNLSKCFPEFSEPP